ncbi:phosphodiester glycosidase family protein [Paenibacillus sp. MBLB4367]|uniref:phosphodiester glycosidase family protein n=1 Tax=Paenibacillus sp. MBLB4367 TaxID=3384767 RepID=UPI0039084107
MASYEFKQRIRRRRLAFALSLVVSTGIALDGGAWTPKASANGGVDYETATVGYAGKNFTVQLVTIDLKNPFLRVEPVVASEGIGHVESLSSMTERTQAAAAINGTFFDSYETDDTRRYPNGLMLRAGDVVRSGENQTFAMTVDKAPLISKLKLGITVKVNHKGSSYSFSPWGVNTYYGEDSYDQVVWYTRDFGDKVSFAGGTKVVISNGRITEMTEGEATIPEDGQVCFIGHTDGNKKYMLSKLHVGDEVTVEAKVENKDSGQTSGSGGWEAAIGVGPKLVTNGAVDVDFARDGFDDPKITSTSNVRSFVGIDGRQRMVMGTVSSATISEMANVLVELGVTDAMNMDGGASSGLYYEGSMKRAPGRLLSNALVVRRYAEPQVQVVVNGTFISEYRGFIRNQTTMAPFRGIFEAISADFTWNNDERTLSVQRGGKRIVLRPDESTALVDGKPVLLDEAATIIDGHMYIPLRFVAETLGAKVIWNQDLYRAELTVPE